MSTPCFAFYSYKGGSGRSTVLMNTVGFLADKLKATPEHPILVVDADLESAGLTYLFDCERKFCVLGSYCIDTCRVLTDGDIQNDDYQEEFRSGIYKIPTDEKRYPIKHYTIDKLNEFVIRDEDKLSDSDFDGVKLSTKDLELIENVLKECISGEYADHMNRLYKIAELTERIRKAESPEEKYRIIIDTIPSRSFCDISDKYNKEAWTIRFLGIDTIHSAYLSLNSKNEDDNGGELLGNDAGQLINRSLLVPCEKNNYAAVIIDSGSGTQSSAHAVHLISDVLVYCMRPSKQFVKGTLLQISNYEGELNILLASKADTNKDGKPVIILPNAVPQMNTVNQALVEIKERRFREIQHICELFPNIIDSRFCSYETCLREVERFKWEESRLYDTEQSNIQNQDEKDAYIVYEELADSIIYNTIGDNQ